MLCDCCGKPSKHFFLRLKGDDEFWIGSCCVNLKQDIKEVLEHQCLNSMEICRVFNGIDNPSDCYLKQGFAFITRPERCNHKENNCTFWSLTIYNILRQLERKSLIYSKKIRFFDDRKGVGRRTDIFRFWFGNKENYRKRILLQTMDGYTS